MPVGSLRGESVRVCVRVRVRVPTAGVPHQQPHIWAAVLGGRGGGRATARNDVLAGGTDVHGHGHVGKT